MNQLPRKLGWAEGMDRYGNNRLRTSHLVLARDDSDDTQAFLACGHKPFRLGFVSPTPPTENVCQNCMRVERKHESGTTGRIHGSSESEV